MACFFLKFSLSQTLYITLSSHHWGGAGLFFFLVFKTQWDADSETCLPHTSVLCLHFYIHLKNIWFSTWQRDFWILSQQHLHCASKQHPYTVMSSRDNLYLAYSPKHFLMPTFHIVSIFDLCHGEALVKAKFIQMFPLAFLKLYAIFREDLLFPHLAATFWSAANRPQVIAIRCHILKKRGEEQWKGDLTVYLYSPNICRTAKFS